MTAQVGSGQSAAALSQGLAQLLYSNVDRVVDGRSTSGWQTMEASASLGEEARKQLLSLVETNLKPVRDLPGFPTPEEVATAERRLVQSPADLGTVLVHTAPAGVDTTGRPNTVTHVLVLPPEAEPAVPTVSWWRSAGWVVPFGPEQVRQASLPEAAALRPGQAVTDDSVAAFIAAEPRAAVLSALADALEERLLARVNGQDWDGRASSVVVMGCDSTDEAALWVAALQWTCAPATTRLLGYSTLERVAGTGDLDRAATKRLDLVFAPHADLEAAARAGALVIDPAAPPTTPPRTNWGRLVSVVAQDLGSWMAGTQAVREILSLLRDHRRLSPAWPLAVAECCNPGLLGDLVGNGLSQVVERALVDCYPPELAEQPYLSQVISDRVLGSSTREPAEWWSRLEALPVYSQGNAVVAGLVEKYLETAARSRDWLLDTGREATAATRRLLRAWSAEPTQAARLRELLGTMLRTVEEQGPDPLVRLQLADRLLRDGLHLPADYVPELFNGLCTMLLNPQGRDLEQVLSLPLGSSTRWLIAQRVEEMLQEEAQGRRLLVLPGHAGAPLAWVARGLPEVGPYLSMELCAAVLCGTVGTKALPAGVNHVDMLVGLVARCGLQVRFSEELTAELGQVLTPEQVRRLPASVPSRAELLGAVVLAHPQDPVSLELARAYLQEQRLSEQVLLSSVLPRVPVSTASCVVAWFCAAPVLAYAPQQVLAVSQNALVALSYLPQGLGASQQATVSRAQDKALSGLLLCLWAGLPVPQVPQWVSADLVRGLPQRLGAQEALLVPVGPAAVDRVLTPVAFRLFLVSRSGSKMPEDWQNWADQYRRQLEANEAASVVALRSQDEAAMAVCRAGVAILPAPERDRFVTAAVRAVNDPPGFSKWLSKNIASSAGGPAEGLRRLFGAH